MPQPKKYTTKEQQLEAHRLNNQRHYNNLEIEIDAQYLIQRNSSGTKHLKKQKPSRLLRRKQRLQRKKKNKASSPGVIAPEVRASNKDTLSREVQRELEQRVESLKQDWLTHMNSKGGYAFYLEHLYIRTSIWATQRRTPLSPVTISPAAATVKAFEKLLMDYQATEEEYFYLICNLHGPVWQQKREDFTIFKEIVGETLVLV
ncbi:hypothetical protein V5O48_014363 [Marasmius crinis-equi]|uniref:Uncharacterized protein n=1 Tax=Marasmius crinis-equi TaxID=585013 RepID=A0ABR3EXH9_9AGAR